MKPSVQSTGFTQAIALAFKNYANFAGRSSRSEYWWFTLFASLVILLFIPFILLCFIEGVMVAGYVLFALLTIFEIAIFLPSLALSIRRLHDTGRSGWWYLLAFIPLGGIAIFVLACVPSDMNENEYGKIILDGQSPQTEALPLATSDKSHETYVNGSQSANEDINTKTISTMTEKVIENTTVNMTDNIIDRFPELKLRSTIGRSWQRPVYFYPWIAALCFGVLIAIVASIAGIGLTLDHDTQFRVQSIREVYPNEEIYTADGQKADFTTTSLILYDIVEAAEYDEGKVYINAWGWTLSQNERWGKGTTLQEAYNKASNSYWTYAIPSTCVFVLAFVLALCLGVYLFKISFKYMFNKKNTDLQGVTDYIVDYEYKITKKMLLIFAKDNKFGVLNFKKKKIIIAPVYDYICWREQDILLYGEADGRKVLIDAYSGKELV